MQNRNTTLRELATELGISQPGTLKLIKKYGLGVMQAGMWMLSANEVEVAKRHCRAYMLANR